MKHGSREQRPCCLLVEIWATREEVWLGLVNLAGDACDAVKSLLQQVPKIY